MDCVFCQIVKKEIPAKIEYEDAEILAFADIAPKAPIHLLIIPKKHIEGIKELGEKEIELGGRLLTTAVKLAQQKGIALSGFRLIFNSGPDGGQEVNHLHLHLLGGKPLGPMIVSQEDD